jgi:Tfp pilus assembly protein PilN
MTDLIAQIAVIDFLPARYGEQNSKRRAHLYRGVVVLVFATVLGTSCYFQYQMYDAARRDLAAAEPAYADAQQATLELAAAQKLLLSAEQQAEFLTYLRHPWSRSQLLSALVEPLPETLTLRTLSLSYQADQKKQNSTASPGPSESQPAAASQPPALVRGLKKLRDDCDSSQLVIVLTGVTSETAALHQYLAALAASESFSSVDLGSIESGSGKSSATSQFTVRIVVRPGYGQPHGPAPSVGIVRAASPSPRSGA